MLQLNEIVAEAISTQVNRDTQQDIFTPSKVHYLSDGMREDTPLIDFYWGCRLYGEVTADAPFTTVINGIAYCTFCGHQIISDECSCTP